MMNNIRKTAVFYARVSDRKQAEKEVSIPSQIERGKQKSVELNADLIRVFVDEGKSGRSDARPDFLKAIEYCELFQPDYLIFWSSSRFARNRFDAAFYKRRLEKAGVKWVYISMDVDVGSASGKLFDGLLELMDEHKSIETSNDTKRSMMSNAKQGYFNGGVPPLGYVALPDPLSPKRKKLMIQPDEAVLVLDIFKMRLSGYGAKMIATSLNDEGRLRRGKPWSKNTVLALLKNETVVGNVIFNRRDKIKGGNRPRDEWVVVKSHPSIITTETWDAVQSLIKDASPGSHGSSKSNFIFTGMMKCHKCKGSMIISTSKGRSKRYSYYQCRKTFVGEKCDKRRIRADVADPWLLDTLIRIIFSEDNLDILVKEMLSHFKGWSGDHEQRLKSIHEDIRSAKQKNSKLYDILELHGVDAPNLADLTERIRENKAVIDRLQTKLAGITAETVPGLNIKGIDVKALSDSLTLAVKDMKEPKKLRSFFGGFISSIMFFGDQVQIEYVPDALLHKPKAVHSKLIWLPERCLLSTRKQVVDAPEALVRRVSFA